MTNLPGMLADVAEIAGEASALALARKLGGASVSVPAPGRLQADHPIADAIGMKAATAVARRFSGESVYIPKARRALVVDLHRQGLPRREIALRCGITVQAAGRYIRESAQPRS